MTVKNIKASFSDWKQQYILTKFSNEFLQSIVNNFYPNTTGSIVAQRILDKREQNEVSQHECNTP